MNEVISFYNSRQHMTNQKESSLRGIDFINNWNTSTNFELFYFHSLLYSYTIHIFIYNMKICSPKKLIQLHLKSTNFENIC